MANTRGNRPASPIVGVSHQYTGITLREHFAAMAMQGFCADSKDAEMSGIAKSSVMMADALLKALEEG